MAKNGLDTAKDIDTRVGVNVRARRREVGMNQIALAKHLGVTFQMVQKYERGQCRMSVGRLAVTAQVLGWPLDWFTQRKPGRL